MTWTRVASLDDLWDGEMMPVEVAGRAILLCNLVGEVFAYADECPHLANPLSLGCLSDGVLTCAAHEWVFDMRKGIGVNPAATKLKRFPVRLDGDWILIDSAEEHR